MELAIGLVCIMIEARARVSLDVNGVAVKLWGSQVDLCSRKSD